MPRHTLYAAGYARWTPLALRSTVRRLDALCVDVRIAPRSQRPAWGGSALRALLGDAYQHMPDLGNPNAFNGGPLALHRPDRGIPALLGLLERQPVIILCQCDDGRVCHRSLIVAAVQQAAPDQAVTHLEPPPLADGAILAISLHQPWASLFVVDAQFPGAGKRDETRSFGITHRGWLAIHAAKGGLSKRSLAAWCARPPFRAALARIGVTTADQLPRGAVVAVTRVRDVAPTKVCYPDPAPDDPNWHFGDFSPGRFAWRCGATLALPTPIPVVGRQGLFPWHAPAEVWAILNAAGGAA